MGSRAVVYIQRGPTVKQQTTECLEYAAAEDLEVFALAPWWAPQDAVNLVRSGACDVVLVAFESRAAHELAGQLDRGQVIRVHPVPKVIAPPKVGLPSLADLILRWRRKGRTVEEIARDIGESTGEIRSILRTTGEYPIRSD